MISLSRFCFTVATLGLFLSSCAPAYREVRRQAPGGGYYIERVPINPEDKAKKLKKNKNAKAAPIIDDGSFWKGDGVPGTPKIVIDLGEQRITYFKGEQLVGASPISSGRESHATTTGSFSIIQKDLDHKSSLYGDYVDETGQVVKRDVDVRKDKRPPGTKFDGASMRYFMRITGAIGMHEGYLPGFPASHGCIRLPTHMAETFFKATPHGTRVQIVGKAPIVPFTETAPVPVNAPPAVANTRRPPPPVPGAAFSSQLELLQPRKVRNAAQRQPGQTLYLNN